MTKEAIRWQHRDPDPRITPYLLYEDVSAALDWLGRAFGLTPFGGVFKGPDGRINHAAMKLADGAVMMGCPGPAYRNPSKLGGVTQNLYVRVDDIDSHFARAKSAGAKILEELADTFYGHRRYGAEDPEGHVWYFAAPIAPARSKRKKTGKKPSSVRKSKAKTTKARKKPAKKR